jgi:hypothetical protein
MYIVFTHKYGVVKSILLIFLREMGLFLVCLTVEKNVGMPENYIFMMDYEWQEKRRHSALAEICKSSKSIYYLIDFTNYFLSVNTNSDSKYPLDG